MLNDRESWVTITFRGATMEVETQERTAVYDVRGKTKREIRATLHEAMQLVGDRAWEALSPYAADAEPGQAAPAACPALASGVAEDCSAFNWPDKFRGADATIKTVPAPQFHSIFPNLPDDWGFADVPNDWWKPKNGWGEP